jgi:transcriptional regulator with XRE-family HTH domain
MLAAMQLAAYLTQADIKPSAFAERIGVTRQTLWRYMSGERRPEWDVLERIKRETEGHVTPNDFLEEQVAATTAASASTAPEMARAG